MALTINTNIKNEANGYSLDASQVKGGYMVVANQDERNAIPAATKVNGTTIYQADVGKEYRWDGSEWAEVASGGTSVIANPTLSGSEAGLSALQIGDTKYRIEGSLTTLMVGIDSSLLGG